MCDIYNAVWLYRWISKPQYGLKMCANVYRHTPLGMLLPPSLFPELFYISSSVSFPLQNNESSSYTSMFLHIDLIEHIVDKVLRNPQGARYFFPAISDHFTKTLKSLPYILSFFFFFCPSVHSITAFPTPISVSIFPLLSTQPLHCFFTSLLLLLFPSSQSSCVPV